MQHSAADGRTWTSERARAAICARNALVAGVGSMRNGALHHTKLRLVFCWCPYWTGATKNCKSWHDASKFWCDATANQREFNKKTNLKLSNTNLCSSPSWSTFTLVPAQWRPLAAAEAALAAAGAAGMPVRRPRRLAAVSAAVVATAGPGLQLRRLPRAR